MKHAMTTGIVVGVVVAASLVGIVLAVIYAPSDVETIHEPLPRATVLNPALIPTPVPRIWK